MRNKIIAVDGMGGDNAPVAVVEGCVLALKENPAISIILTGNESEINSLLSTQDYDKNRLTIVNTTEVITNEDQPTVAIKSKKDSSLVVAMNMVKSGEAQAVVSAGNTGALLAGSTVIIGRIKGIDRPALATLLPNRKASTFLLDSGANVDTKAKCLVQFAQMGSLYMEHVMGIAKPKVGLINIGAEKEKGNALTKEAYELLENAGINFVGNVEAREIPMGTVDVAVCDAFVGNIILKYSEGFAKALLGMIKDELMSSTVSKLGGMLASGAFKNLKGKFDYDAVGGAPFLGLKGLVVKAHGSSNAKAFKNAIGQCSAFIDNDITERIQQLITAEA